MSTYEFETKVRKAAKAAYDNAWRKEPVWVQRKVAGRAAAKAVREEYATHYYNWVRSQPC